MKSVWVKAYSEKASGYDTYRTTGPGEAAISKYLCKFQNSGVDILDLGCGTGAFFEQLLMLCPNSLDAMDPSDAMINAARKRTTDLLTKLPDDMPKPRIFKGSSLDGKSCSYDLIFCGQVVQNLTSDPAKAEQLRHELLVDTMRLLRPGGCLILTTRLVPPEGRLSDTYWYADPAVVAAAVRAFEAVVPQDPVAEFQRAGFVDAELTVSPDRVIRKDAYLNPDNLKIKDFRAADSFFQWVEHFGELEKLLEFHDGLKAANTQEQYVEERDELSEGNGHVAVIVGFKPTDKNLHAVVTSHA